MLATWQAKSGEFFCLPRGKPRVESFCYCIWHMGEKEKKVNWNQHVEGKKITKSELACGGVITDSEWASEKKTEGVLT